MKFIRTKIADVIVCEPEIHGDSRGYFVETFREDKLAVFLGFNLKFVQDNESKGERGVLRGLHYQLPPYAQSKLVRVIDGAVLDVAVDIRKGSPTFGEYVAVTLTSENKRQLLVPRGFAHGFVVLSETAIFAYKVDNYYSQECDRGIAFDSKEIGIDWEIDRSNLKLSNKDMGSLCFSKATELFDIKDSLYD